MKNKILILKHNIKRIWHNKIIKKKYLNSLCPICYERVVTHYPMAPDDEDSNCWECREEIKNRKMIICKKCKSKSSIAGQAFTQYSCEECGKSELHANTATPKICKDCSEKLNECQKCREDLILDAI